MHKVAYQHFAVVSFNSGPVVPGVGSAIFLHDDTGNATDGCVSLPAPALDALLRWLNPAASPLIVIGTDASIRRY
jgi:L,D-peptidoglycan transpeptidase YkuD (ErfK/YbiS/YcfS/YnhG family)